MILQSFAILTSDPLLSECQNTISLYIAAFKIYIFDNFKFRNCILVKTFHVLINYYIIYFLCYQKTFKYTIYMIIISIIPCNLVNSKSFNHSYFT
jgi:hypothetical protein